MRRDVAALSAADGVGRSAAAPTASGGGARNADGGVVLLGAADVIRDVARRGHVVELRGRVFLAGPRLAAILRYVGAAVVALHHAQRVGGVDPEIVIVAVRCGQSAVGFSAVGGAVEARIQDVHRVLHLRVGIDARVVESALPQATVFAE